MSTTCIDIANGGITSVHGCGGNTNPNNTGTVYVNNSNYPVNYSIAKPASGNLIYASKWLEVYNTINTELTRRGSATISNPGLTATSIITASKLNTLNNAINLYWSDGTVATGANITAANLNYIIDKVVYCGSVCVCNCAYCTCNCNYCSCNCNYCTCNCNY